MCTLRPSARPAAYRPRPGMPISAARPDAGEHVAARPARVEADPAQGGAHAVRLREQEDRQGDGHEPEADAQQLVGEVEPRPGGLAGVRASRSGRRARPRA